MSDRASEKRPALLKEEELTSERIVEQKRSAVDRAKKPKRDETDRMKLFRSKMMIYGVLEEREARATLIDKLREDLKKSVT